MPSGRSCSSISISAISPVTPRSMRWLRAVPISSYERSPSISSASANSIGAICTTWPSLRRAM